MVLLLHQDLANLFRHRVLPERFALPDAIAVIADGLVLIVEIEAEHLLRVFRRAHRLGSHRRHLAEIVDLTRDGQGMIEFLLGVDFQLGGDVHVLRASEHLRIDHVANDGLIFAGQIFVEQFRQTVARDVDLVRGGFRFRHAVSPFKLKANCEDQFSNQSDEAGNLYPDYATVAPGGHCRLAGRVRYDTNSNISNTNGASTSAPSFAR